MITALATIALAAMLSADTDAADAAFLKNVPEPPPVKAPTPEQIDKAIARGVQFLVASQNSNGSWGSPRRTKGLNIYAPVPGAHQAFRAAVTSLCIAALIEAAPENPDAKAAIDRAEAWLVQNLPHVRRATGDAIYNSWAHGYSIQALVRLIKYRKQDPDKQEKFRQLILQQIDMLRRYECLTGGWCYYDFNAQTARPSGDSVSFTTAAILVGLKEAEEAGIDVPDKLVERALEAVRRQRKPDFSYLYAEDFIFYPMADINRPGGSLGRSQACNFATRIWGDEAVTDQVIEAWLKRLFARNGWLDMARKRPVPHESWFAVAAYFFYFGHYYAARCIEVLPPEKQDYYKAHLAHVLLLLQEKDGSWWDFPFYDYHQQYGTAFALMSLVRCR